MLEQIEFRRGPSAEGVGKGGISRIKAEGEGFCHVVSRIANKEFLLNNDGKMVKSITVRPQVDLSGVYPFFERESAFHPDK